MILITVKQGYPSFVSWKQGLVQSNNSHFHQCNNEWFLSSLSWSTRCSTTWHHRICQVIASSLPPPGAVSFDHQTTSSAPLLTREFQ